ncbi:hypothetical protein PV08_08680 [Exophiala spinifera]|uniref:3-oxoacyl-[acyl-carrier-protein] reductase n=1 Tax=Exophiala spinifera TaxID=91928 RepID=A0A0D1ZL16_9EURO|nr:uncharacterized protein PV08_08680 [Exophiala spinifera]KIW13492.1 hypothetical protein PV08_08680 [Exophiala spinifera]
MSSSSSSSPVWLITAASSGFGKFIALEALSRGHMVLATARNATKIDDLKSAGAKTYALDVTWDTTRLQTAVDQMVQDVGRIDILVNAAGYILEGALEEVSPEETLAEFTTNVFGMINVTRAVLPTMRAQRSGVVANFGSLGSWIGGAAYSNYAATKWACSAVSESLAEELKPLGITCTVVEPGYFRTGFLNPGARVKSARVIDDYTDTVVGQVRNALDSVDNNQPGDVVKGSKVIVDVLTRTGAAAGREIPIRLVLGRDCVETIRQKCESTLKLLNEWEPIITSTDHDNA